MVPFRIADNACMVFGQTIRLVHVQAGFSDVQVARIRHSGELPERDR